MGEFMSSAGLLGGEVVTDDVLRDLSGAGTDAGETSSGSASGSRTDAGA
jgi:hypothetical protein